MVTSTLSYGGNLYWLLLEEQQLCVRTTLWKLINSNLQLCPFSMGVALPTGAFNVALSPFCHEIASRGVSKILWPLDAKPTANTKLLTK